jgi:hypothetical protein
MSEGRVTISIEEYAALMEASEGLRRLRLSGGGSPPTDAGQEMTDTLHWLRGELCDILDITVGDDQYPWNEILKRLRGRAEPGEGERLTDALEALAGWIAVAAENGAYVSEDLREWSSGTLRGKSRTPAEAARAALREAPPQDGERLTDWGDCEDVPKEVVLAFQRECENIDPDGVPSYWTVASCLVAAMKVLRSGGPQTRRPGRTDAGVVNLCATRFAPSRVTPP